MLKKISLFKFVSSMLAMFWWYTVKLWKMSPKIKFVRQWDVTSLFETFSTHLNGYQATNFIACYIFARYQSFVCILWGATKLSLDQSIPSYIFELMGRFTWKDTSTTSVIHSEARLASRSLTRISNRKMGFLSVVFRDYNCKRQRM